MQKLLFFIDFAVGEIKQANFSEALDALPDYLDTGSSRSVLLFFCCMICKIIAGFT